DGVAHVADRAVAKHHAEAAGVGAAELLVALHAGQVLARLGDVRAAEPLDVLVGAHVGALVVAAVGAVVVRVGVEVLFADQIGVGGAVANRAGGDLAGGENHARRILPFGGEVARALRVLHGRGGTGVPDAELVQAGLIAGRAAGVVAGCPRA